MDTTMRDDIWYRGEYRPTAPGERRVMLSDAQVWYVDRAEYDPRSMLTWYAEQHDTTHAKAALMGYAQMRQYLLNPNAETGYFIPEQLCQLAANLAARRSESHEDPAHVCGELARAMVQTLVAMPLTEAMTNLVQAELVPDNGATVQAQLLLRAAYHSNSPRIAGLALDARSCGSFGWEDVEVLNACPEACAQLHLSSPELISVLRRELDFAHGQHGDVLQQPFCGFEAETPISEAYKWLNHFANLPIEHPRKSGTIRVVEDWITGQHQAMIQNGDHLELMDHGSTRSNRALAAYARAKEECTNEVALSDLERDGVVQRAAHLSRYELAPMGEAVTNAVWLARKEANTLFKVSEESWLPLKQAEATDNPSGTLLLRGLHQQNVHTLTKHGIAHLKQHFRGQYLPMAAADDQFDLQYRQTPESVSFQVQVQNPIARLNHQTTPLIRAAVLGMYVEGKPVKVFQAMTEDNKATMLQLANLAQHDFIADDGPAFDHELEHVYSIRLRTEMRDSDGEIIVDSPEDVTEELEGDELIRLVRDKGITRSPQVEQYGSGAWHVSYRSEMPAEDRDYFEQGIETYYTLQLEKVNGQPVNPDNAKVFAEAVGLHFANPYEPQVSRQAMPRLG